MIKPHWILRTHEGVPVPPSWARYYEVSLRGYKGSEGTFSLHYEPIQDWRWSLEGVKGDIVAIRWIE